MHSNGHRADSLSPDEAARLLGVSERTVRRWIASGKLSGTARPWATTRAALEAWRAQQPHSAPRALEHASPQMEGPPDIVPDSMPVGGRPRARMGVYAITHVPTGRTYIGSSLDIDARLRDHRARLVRGRHANRRLQEAWNAHGAAGFAWSVRDYAEAEDELPALEQQWMHAVRPYYNRRQIAGRARSRPARRYMPRRAPAQTRAAPSSGAAATLASMLSAELAGARDQIERLARENGRLAALLEQSTRSSPPAKTLARRLARWLSYTR